MSLVYPSAQVMNILAQHTQIQFFAANSFKYNQMGKKKGMKNSLTKGEFFFSVITIRKATT